MNRYVTDGSIVTDGKCAMGIFSATNYLNSVIDRLEEAEKVIAFYASETTNYTAVLEQDETSEYLENGGDKAQEYQEKYNK